MMVCCAPVSLIRHLSQAREVGRLKQENQMLSEKMNIIRREKLDLVDMHQRAIAEKVIFAHGEQTRSL